MLISALSHSSSVLYLFPPSNPNPSQISFTLIHEHRSSLFIRRVSLHRIIRRLPPSMKIIKSSGGTKIRLIFNINSPRINVVRPQPVSNLILIESRDPSFLPFFFPSNARQQQVKRVYVNLSPSPVPRLFIFLKQE